MLSPTPFSLLCALLLCFPLVIFFTLTTPTSTSTATATAPAPTIIKHFVSHQIRARIKLRPLLSPPPPTKREEDDENPLLRLAFTVSRNPTRPGKIAFLFLTTTPLPFGKLWELYFNNVPKTLFNIYIHADPSYNYTPPFTGVFRNRVIPSKPARRLSPTLSSAARRLLAHALLDDRSNSMFALLSPSCIPLHSFNFTYRILTKSKKSFIEILNNETTAYSRWAARGVEAMLPEVELEKFRIGSQFWVLTRKHARIVVGDKRFWPKFNLPCVDIDVCYVEENYFPTLIHLRDPRGSIPVTLTHVDWRGSSDGHPRMYNSTEVGKDLIVRLRNDIPRYGDDGKNVSDSFPRQHRYYPFLFARKFSSDSLLPLLKIAKVILRD